MSHSATSFNVAAADSSPMTTKDKAPLLHAATTPAGGWKKGIAIFDFILRICAVVVSLAAASAMGTSGETLPFFTQFFQFQAGYDDFPTFQYVLISYPFAAI